MLRSAYKYFSFLNLAEVTSKNDSKPFKVAPIDGTILLKRKKLPFAIRLILHNQCDAFRRMMSFEILCAMISKIEV